MADAAEAGTDAELITAARAGDEQAYGELYRRHASPARRFAQALADHSADAEDLVAEAFARVLAALKSGNGPAEAFRPYLLSTVRDAFHDSARRSARKHPVEELAPVAPWVAVEDPAAATDERRLVATAFQDLPERWQLVLWHTEVEGEQPADVAPLLGISADAVAALAYRARAGLRERYRRAHIGTAVDEECRPTVSRLPTHTRNRLFRTEAARVRRHLDTCSRCRLLFGELADVNSRLGALLGPVVLGGAAIAYLATRGAASGVIVVDATGGGVRAPQNARGQRLKAAAALGAAAGVVAAVLAVLPDLPPAPAESPAPAATAAASGVRLLPISVPDNGSSTGGGDRAGVTIMSGPVSVVTAGNSLLSCPLLALTCPVARAGAGAAEIAGVTGIAGVAEIDNDDYVLEPFGDPLAPLGAPFESAVSGATLTLEGEVLWARLYWAGTGTPPSVPTAYVRTPTAAGYRAVGAARVSQVFAPWLDRPVYQAVADVTELARSGRASGPWWVAVPSSAFATGAGAFAGWALVAIVDDGGPPRSVAVVDGLVAVSGTEPVSVRLTGLASGSATVGLVAWDGDRGRTGDGVTLDGVPLDAPSPDNVLASRTAGTPAGWNTFGTDAVVLTGTAPSRDPVVTAVAGDDEWLLGALIVATGP